jgi:hypothetical protein
VSSGVISLFSISTLRGLAGQRAFDRGTAYAAGGRVTGLVLDGDSASATVRGTQLYRARLWIDAGAPAHSCTCPVGEEGTFCKHCVALGLVLAGDGAALTVEAEAAGSDIRAYLRSLEKERLIDLLLEQAGEDEFLRGRLLVDAAGARGTVDVAQYRWAIDDVFNPSEYVDWRSAYAYSRGIERVIDSVEALLGEGHSTAVIELCEHALDCLEDALGRVDDSDGYLGSIRDRLADLHHRACVEAHPDPTALAARLFEQELYSEWDVFYGAAASYADVLGEEGMAEYRRLAEGAWSRIPPIGPGEERGHSSFRFHIASIMETLAELADDTVALVEVLARDLSSAYQFVRIAERLAKAGRHDDVLGWAERGVAAFPARTDVRLLEILAEEYHRRDRHIDAVALMWNAFVERSGLDSYQRLHTHAIQAGSWMELREKALAHLRAEAALHLSSPTPRTRWGPTADHSDLVRVFLWEGDVEAAWREAVAGGCSAPLWMDLAPLREAEHPAEVVPVYQAEVERLVDQKNNRAYEEAVQMMKRVQKAMKRAGDGEEFPAYAARIRAANKPKRNLIKLLDHEGW